MRSRSWVRLDCGLQNPSTFSRDAKRSAGVVCAGGLALRFASRLTFRSNIESQREPLPRITRFILALLVLALVSVGYAAEPLKVIVTSVSGGSVFINQGRSAGVTVGSRVRFNINGAAPADGVVIDVSSSSARIEMYQQMPPPPLGTSGELVIHVESAPTTAPTAVASTQPTSRPTAPVHAPWTRKEDPRSADLPLLAPAFSRPASKRSSTFHGRAFANMTYSKDEGSGSNNQYVLARVGTDLNWTNPFEQGGAIRFNGSFDHRGQDLSSSGNNSSDDAILNRFSYAVGGEMYSPYRLELGRFTSYYLPEAGLFDGVEYAVRLQNGLDLGAGIGLYPQPSTDRKEGDDIGFHIFADFKTDNSGMFSWTLGYQKTWHKLDPDKDTLFARASLMLNQAWWLYSSLQADVYNSQDTVKSSGIDLTNAFLQARYSPDNLRGASLSMSHFTYQETKTDEFSFIPAELIRRGKNDRVELSLWRNINERIRPTLRTSYFSSQIDDGYGAELDLDWAQFFRTALDFHCAVFYNKASLTTDMGLRTELYLRKGDFDGSIGYEMLRYRSTGGLDETDYLTRHAIRGSAGWQLDQWYLSITADHYFGDLENANVLGTFVEYRF